MSWRKTLAGKWTWLSLAWLILTVSLVGWWMIHALEQSANDERLRRMFLWEGSFLLGFLFLGGAGLVYLTFHHQARHERLRMFFSMFAHDLKTSITRLRLQSELLEESALGKDPKIASILKDIQRLDLQLENSLWMAQIDSGSLLIQKTALRDVVEHLRNEFGDVRMEINRDADVLVDRRAFAVVLRNLFHNSLMHGQADRIDLVVKTAAPSTVVLEIGDNGKGLSIPAENLGREILSSNRSSRGNGLGLYLSRRLMERMEGRLEFRTAGRFVNVLTVKGGPA